MGSFGIAGLVGCRRPLVTDFIEPLRETLSDNPLVGRNSEEPLRGIVFKLVNMQFDEGDSVRRKDVASALVVSPALLIAGHSAHRLTLVKKRHGLAVLALAVFNDQAEIFVVGIDG